MAERKEVKRPICPYCKCKKYDNISGDNAAICKRCGKVYYLKHRARMVSYWVISKESLTDVKGNFIF